MKCNVMGNALKCPDDRQGIDGLCYKKCPDGWEHVPGMPYNCRMTGAPSPYGRGVGTPFVCAEGKEQEAASCYDPAEKGWYRLAATYWQKCPDGAKDIGVACERENYNRGVGQMPNVLSQIMRGIVG